MFMSLPDHMFDQVDAWKAAGDRRAVFLDCYARMTANMTAGLGAGRFHDQRWVAALLERFADYYFQALASYAQVPEDVPAPWRVAFEAAKQDDTGILQHLFLGVNAHINHDLVLALNDLLRNEWPAMPDTVRQQRYEDYCTVNQIITETIDIVQDEVVEHYAPLWAIVDVGLTRLDEWLVIHLLRRWREEVWLQGQVMVQLLDEEDLADLRREIEARAEARAVTIRTGGHWSTLLE